MIAGPHPDALRFRAQELAREAERLTGWRFKVRNGQVILDETVLSPIPPKPGRYIPKWVSNVPE